MSGAIPSTDASALLGALVDLITERVAERVAEKLGRKPFLTVADIASEMGVTPRAIRTARQRGELPGKRIGHALVFARADVEGWVAGTPSERRRNLTDAAIADRALAAAGLLRR